MAAPAVGHDATISSLLTDIEKIFNDGEKFSDDRLPLGGKFHGSPARKFYSGSQALSRRHTFHSLGPSREWFKLSPKSKHRRRSKKWSKKWSKIYRSRSDSLLLHEGLASVQKLPVFYSPKSRGRVPLPSTPVEGVQRRLFTPDSGYGSPSERVVVDDDNNTATPRIPKYIIGASVNFGRLDVISELTRSVPEIIPGILAYLSEEDLLCFAQVSRRWNEGLQHTSRDNERRLAYLCKKRIAYRAKKMLRGCDHCGHIIPSATNTLKENAHRMVRRSQAMTRSASVIGDIQVTAAPQRPSRRSSSRQRSRHEEFWQAKNSLLDGESQMKCQCGSPARVTSSGARAKCNNCQSDLCTRCRSRFHAERPCRTATGGGEGSVLTPKSRRNLRRL